MVFGEYDNHNGIVHFFDCFIIFAIEGFIGILSSVGILLNIIILQENICPDFIFYRYYSNRIL